MNFHFGSTYVFTVNESFLFSSIKNLNKHSGYPLSLRSLQSSWGDIKTSFSHALHPIQSAGPTESIQRDHVRCKCYVISVLNISQRTLSHSKWKMSSRHQQWGGLYERAPAHSKVGVLTWCPRWLSVAVIRWWSKATWGRKRNIGLSGYKSSSWEVRAGTHGRNLEAREAGTMEDQVA